MNNTRYEDYGSPARDLDELRLLMEAWSTEMIEKIRCSYRPERLMSQKEACAYVVYARSFGVCGQYTSGFV